VDKYISGDPVWDDTYDGSNCCDGFGGIFCCGCINDIGNKEKDEVGHGFRLW